MKHFTGKLTLFLCLLLAIWACEDTIPDKDTNTNPISFSSPQVGQKAYFQRYTTTCGNLNLDFELSGDTLEVELIRQNGAYYLEERFTQGSPLYEQGNTDPVAHRIVFRDDYVLIPERTRSTLFFFYGNDTIHIKPAQRENMTQSACRIDFQGQTFVGNEIGNINSFQIGPLSENNKTVVSCVPIILDLDAYLIYDENQLLMSHTILGDGSVSGWHHID